MSALAPTLQAFFTDRLVRQRHASPCTVAAYRDTFRLLLDFVRLQTGKAPSAVDWDDLDVPTISAFLDLGLTRFRGHHDTWGVRPWKGGVHAEAPFPVS